MQDVRWKQRFEHLQKAFLFLEKGVHRQIYDELQAAGLVQAFEFTFELSWKTLKDYQNFLGTSLSYPREIIKEAFQSGIIEDGHTWISMLDQRNELRYDEEQSKQTVVIIREKYFPAMKQVYLTLKQLAET